MIRSWKAALFKLVLITVSVFLIPTQAAYAQTIAEFSTKSEQEQRKIVEGYVATALEQLSNTSGKTNEKVIIDRRFANLIRAVFTERKDGKNIKNSTSEAFGIEQLRVWANGFKSDPEVKSKTIKRLFEVYVSQLYKDLYANSDGVWKKDFDSLTNEQQETQFRVEHYLKLLNDRIKTLDSEIEQKDKEIKGNEKRMKEIDGDNQFIEAYIAINKLNLSFKASKANPQVGTLVFKNATEFPVNFNLVCSAKSSKAKTLTISITANGVKEVELANGKNYVFAVGELCEIYHGDEKIKSFCVPER